MHVAPRAVSVWPSDSVVQRIADTYPFLRDAHVQRLKTREQFQAVLAGRIVARTAHFAMHSSAMELMAAGLPPSSTQFKTELAGPGVMIGALVPKRWARRAVTRNLIKRQIYNVAALFASELPMAAHVVRLRSAFDRAHFRSASSEPLKRSVRAELEQLFSRAATTSKVAAC